MTRTNRRVDTHRKWAIGYAIAPKPNTEHRIHTVVVYPGEGPILFDTKAEAEAARRDMFPYRKQAEWEGELVNIAGWWLTARPRPVPVSIQTWMQEIEN